MRPAFAAFFIAAALQAAPAGAYVTRWGERVEPRGEGQFEVLASPGQGAPRSWCAAGEYVVQRLGMSPSTPIWRLSPPPRRAGEGVLFALSPEGAAEKTGLLMLDAGDGALTAAHAQALCDLAAPYPMAD